MSTIHTFILSVPINTNMKKQNVSQTKKKYTHIECHTIRQQQELPTQDKVK